MKKGLIVLCLFVGLATSRSASALNVGGTLANDTAINLSIVDVTPIAAEP
jgi:hypothetical protein